MNDIQQLIDRYLAEGLSSDELARLSRAVHRDDAPAEWLIIREMIDTLTEGEDDYDLILAAREAADSIETPAAEAPAAKTVGAPAAALEPRVSPFLRSTFFRELAAASVFLAAVIGAAFYFTRNLEPQIAEIEKKVYPAVADSPAVSPVPSSADSSAALAFAESSASAASPAVSSASAAAPAEDSVPVASAAGTSVSRVQTAARPSRQGAAPGAAPQKAAASKAVAQQSEAPSAKAPVEVPERRIYSSNLLDQIPENYEAPAHATDEY